MISDFPDQQPFFVARVPLPPTISRHSSVEYGRQSAKTNAKLARYYIEAATWLAQATVHDFGLVFSLQENRFRIPLIASLKFYFPYALEREMEGKVNPVINATLRFLNLNRNPVVEMHIQHYIDINDPRVEIALHCKSSW